eukprot:3801360-Alexandrium_andersonii.AAC.1
MNKQLIESAHGFPKLSETPQASAARHQQIALYLQGRLARQMDKFSFAYWGANETEDWADCFVIADRVEALLASLFGSQRHGWVLLIRGSWRRGPTSPVSSSRRAPSNLLKRIN